MIPLACRPPQGVRVGRVFWFAQSKAMSNLDSVVSAAIEDRAVVPGLSFNLSSQKGASFVRARNWTTFYTSGSNIYSPTTGQKTARILLSDSGRSMLDCSTVRLNFQITNTDNTNPLVLSGRHPACLFYRAQLRVGGALVEDIQHHGRLVSTLQSFRSPAALAMASAALAPPLTL